MSIIHRIVRGARYSEEYGDHPGTAIVLFFIFIGGIAGLARGPLGILFGAGAMALFFVPIWLWGCYERGKDLEKLRMRRGIR